MASAKVFHEETLTADANNLVVKADSTRTRTSIWFLHENSTATVKIVSSNVQTTGFKIPKNTVINPKWLEERDAMFEPWRIYSDTAGVTLYVAEYFGKETPM